MRIIFRKRWRDLLAGLILIGVAVGLLWRPMLKGEILLPLDLVAHMPPWRYSYERVPVMNPIPSDVPLEYYPRRLVATNMMRQGQLPLWNPYVLSGVPLLADGYSALLYPLSLLFVILPVAHAFGWYTLFHLILAGLGTYWAARSLKLRPPAALITGLTYMSCGFTMTWLHFPEFIAVIAWLPVALACVERYECQAAQGRSNLGYGLATATVLALCVLCQLQLAFYAGVGVALYWLARRALSRLRHLSGAIAALAGVAALTLLLSAAQWLPSLELARDGQRTGSVATAASTINLLAFILPTAFGFERTAPTWGAAKVAFLFPYVGILPLLLAMLGAWRARTPQAVGLLVVAITTLGLATMPTRLLAVIPLVNQLPGIDRWAMVLSLALALLAGYSYEQLVGQRHSFAVGLQEHSEEAKRVAAHERRLAFLARGLCLATALIVGLAVLWHLQLFTPRSRYGQYITLTRQHLQPLPVVVALMSLTLVIVATIIAWLRRRRRFRAPYITHLLYASALLLIAIDLAWYGLPMVSSADPRRLFQPTTDLLAAIGEEAFRAGLNGDIVYPPTRTSTLLKRDDSIYRVLGADYPSLQPNTFSVFGVQDVRGYASVFSKRYLQFARSWEGKSGDAIGGLRVYLGQAYHARHLLDLMGVRYVLFNPRSETEHRYQGLELVERNDEGAIYRNPTALPRAFLVHQAEVVREDEALLTRLAAPNFPVSTTVLLAMPPPPLDPLPPGETEVVSISRYEPMHVTVQTEVRGSAMLVLSDTYYPGWEALLDGQPARIYAANSILRGVAVPAGKHTIEFRYRPRPFFIGATMSLLGLVALGAGASVAWRGRTPPGQAQ